LGTPIKEDSQMMTIGAKALIAAFVLSSFSAICLAGERAESRPESPVRGAAKIVNLSTDMSENALGQVTKTRPVQMKIESSARAKTQIVNEEASAALVGRIQMLYEKGFAAAEAGNVDMAIALAQEGLSSAKDDRVEGTLAIARFANLTALAYCLGQDYQLALEALAEINFELPIWQSSRRAIMERLAIEGNRARILRRLGQYGLAETIYLDHVAYFSLSESKNLLLATTWLGYSELLMDCGRVNDETCVGFIRDAFDLIEGNVGDNHSLRIDAISAIARYNHLTQSCAAAEKLYRQAIQLSESRGDSSARVLACRADLYIGLSNVLEASEDVVSAEKYRDKAAHLRGRFRSNARHSNAGQ
jgi:tetratricopeptide (TPR) repeat protein